MNVLDDKALERYARHLSIDRVGESGQLRLCDTRFALSADMREQDDLRLALSRAGLREDVDRAEVVFSASAPRAEDVWFEPGLVAIGDVLRIAAGIEKRWLVGLIASEVIMWRLALRPERYGLRVRFPEYRVVKA